MLLSFCFTFGFLVPFYGQFRSSVLNCCFATWSSADQLGLSRFFESSKSFFWYNFYHTVSTIQFNSNSLDMPASHDTLDSRVSNRRCPPIVRVHFLAVSTAFTAWLLEPPNFYSSDFKNQPLTQKYFHRFWGNQQALLCKPCGELFARRVAVFTSSTRSSSERLTRVLVRGFSWFSISFPKSSASYLSLNDYFFLFSTHSLTHERRVSREDSHWKSLLGRES